MAFWQHQRSSAGRNKGCGPCGADPGPATWLLCSQRLPRSPRHLSPWRVWADRQSVSKVQIKEQSDFSKSRTVRPAVCILFAVMTEVGLICESCSSPSPHFGCRSDFSSTRFLINVIVAFRGNLETCISHSKRYLSLEDPKCTAAFPPLSLSDSG